MRRWLRPAQMWAAWTAATAMDRPARIVANAAIQACWAYVCAESSRVPTALSTEVTAESSPCAWTSRRRRSASVKIRCPLVMNVSTALGLKELRGRSTRTMSGWLAFAGLASDSVVPIVGRRSPPVYV